MIDIEGCDVYDSGMPAPTTEPIGLELARTAKLLSRAFDDELTEAGGSLPTWLILVSLKGRRHGAQREIAEEVGIEGPTLTHHLNRMETAGLVTRRRDPENRRVHRVELTAEGDAMFQRLLQTVRAFDQRLRASFKAKEIAELSNVLGRLRANVADAPLVGTAPSQHLA
jgi:MarR family transcriptional regulator for hemolysin